MHLDFPFAARAITALALLALPHSTPAQEKLDLAGGFQPDPVSVTFAAIGTTASSDAVRGCPGFIAEAPSVEVSLSAANAPLHVFVVGDGAAGLVASDPLGIHHCATIDELGIAHLRIDRILSGEYRVWPAASEEGAQIAGTLLVTEIELNPRDVAAFTGLQIDPALLPPMPGEIALDLAAEPAFGHHVMPSDGVIDVRVTLTDGAPADGVGPGCAGIIDPSRPDLILTLDAPEPLLAISAASQIDTTLVVVAPSGEVLCNDDSFNRDPAVAVTDAGPGIYAIWVGMLSSSAGEVATVSIGRDTVPSPFGNQPAFTLDAAAEPALGRHDLAPGARLDLSLLLGAGASTSQVADGCSGEIDPTRPDVVVSIGTPEPALWFHAAAEGADTTLLVFGPDGSINCNDDFDGVNAALAVQPATPGEYLVWVGSYPGQSGLPATLAIGFEAPAAGTAGGGSQVGVFSPFQGIELQSAAQALSILIEMMGLGEALTYASLEETGPEGFILHDVVLTDPTGAQAPIRVGLIRISDLDLAGLSAWGAPDRFALALEGVSYSDIADDAQAFGLPVPDLAGSVPVSVALSLLPPDGDLTRRQLRFGLGFEGQLGVSLTARMVWPEGATAMGPAGAATMVLGEAVEIELHDMGFLGAALRQAAAESGQTPEALIAETLDELARELSPLTPGSPRERLYAALRAKLQEVDRPGVLTVTFRAAEPLDMDTMMDALAAEDLDESVLQLEVTYIPDQ